MIVEGALLGAVKKGEDDVDQGVDCNEKAAAHLKPGKGGRHGGGYHDQHWRQQAEALVSERPDERDAHRHGLAIYAQL